MSDEINELIKKINNETDPKVILNLRGRLINALKKEQKNQKDPNIKQILDITIVNELEKHKKHIEEMRKNNQNIPITEKLALKVKEISSTIEIFMKKNDVIGKIKNGVKSASISAIFVTAISAGITLLSGGVVNLQLLASLVPTNCYLGLSSLMAALTTDTPISKMYKELDKKPEEINTLVEFTKKYIIENKDFIQALMQDEKEENVKKLIENEKKLISMYEEIIANVPNDEMRQIMTLEKIDVMKKLEKNYCLLENNYLAERIQMTNEEYQEMNSEKRSLVLKMKAEELFIKDVGEEVIKKVGKYTTISYAVRIALSTLFPSLKFTSITDAMLPFIYSLIGTLLASGKIAKAINMKKTDYSKNIIKVTHPELFEEAIELQKTAISTI